MNTKIMEPDQHTTPSMAEDISNPTKKRKIRKGTQSCWECKRRKIRCTFATLTELICDGCKSRQTKCLSQEFHDSTAHSSKTPDRLSYVESLVEKLIQRSGTGLSGLQGDRATVAESPDQVKYPKSNQFNSYADMRPTVETISHRVDLNDQLSDNQNEISHALLKVWPNEHDLDLILKVPISVSVLFHGTVCMPYTKFFSTQITSPQRMLQLPPIGSHPISIARKLLLLATLLQGISSSSMKELSCMGLNSSMLISRLVKTASRLVTSNDELVNSLEGIECIMIESMYMNNAGNLRQAWLTNRRALLIAQAMQLHTCSSSWITIVEENTRGRIDSNFMWCRLVSSDRYLSLMLGLPQGSPGNSLASTKILENCTALDRLEHTHSIAAGLILQRNAAERADLPGTLEIDKLLKDGAALMPPRWWQVPQDLSIVTGTDETAFEETIRLMSQFTHFHLLVQLHLPYMMQFTSATVKYDYNRMTATNASRTIVSLFLSFQGSVLSAAYCRGIDFIAFIASTTLCLAHIEANRGNKAGGQSLNVFQSLQHQRLSDRGLLENTLEIMGLMVQRNNDIVAKKITRILQPLLDIESNSARGTCYSTSASLEPHDSILQTSGSKPVLDALFIEIPYFGTIKIEPRPYISDFIQTGKTNSTADKVGLEAYQDEATDSDWHSIPCDTDRRLSRSVNADSVWSPLNASDTESDHPFVSDLPADVYDWALQGVDTALFNTLTQNTVGLDEKFQ